MVIKISDERKFNKSVEFVGYIEENKATTIEFEFPEYLKDLSKKISFRLKDGTEICKLFNDINSNKFTFTRDLLKYDELQMSISFFNIENEDEILYRTNILNILIDDSIVCDDDISADDPKIAIIDELIEKVTELDTQVTENEATRQSNEETRIANENTRINNENAREEYIKGLKKDVELGNLDGATFTPHVSESGDLSWSNNKNLTNPETVNIKGEKGDKGEKGEQGSPFRIVKTYPNVEAMQADFDNMEVGDYVMITSSIELEDNAKLYCKTETEWVYITDFSGATGIQGPKGDKGDKGDKGEKGDTGVGISKLEVIDGELYVTLTNNVKENAGLILTDEVKAWLVSQITDNAESDFNTYYNSKVTEFNNNATEKTTAYNTNADEKLEEYNTNATNKLNEYNTNATNKINEYNTNAEAILKILPKTETEVLEEIDIDDAGESSFNKLSVFGNSRQESTEGYNLFDYLNNIRNTSGNNITVEKDDKMGYIIVNGTPNVNYAIIVSNLNITDLIEDKQTYTLKQENANNLSINYIYSQIIIENKETLQKQYIGTRTTFKQTFTVDKTTYNYYANIQTGTIESTGTLNNFKTRFMIYKGTDDKTFELYTGGNPSPNPDYPQEIESIKDSITFKRIGESIYNFYNTIYSGERSGIQSHKNNDGSITFIGTPRMSYIYLSDEVDISNLLEDGETYTILQTSYENIYIEIKLRNRVDYTIAKYIKTKDTKQSFLVDKSKYIYVIHVQYGVLPEEGENINTTLKFYLIKGEDDNYTLPVQQNMYALVEGQEDCFVKKDGKWYERHYSFEGELTGEDYNVEKPDTRLAIYNMNTYGFSKGVYNGKTKQYLNYFKFYNNWDNGGSFIAGNSMWFSSSLDKETFKEFIKTKKEEGNPIKIVYIRGEENGSILYPLDLECTPEQVEVLNQLEQFPLQKGINHIFSDDELSPKFQLKYYQDVNILLDKINKSIADVSAQLL